MKNTLPLFHILILNVGFRINSGKQERLCKSIFWGIPKKITINEQYLAVGIFLRFRGENLSVRYVSVHQ